MITQVWDLTFEAIPADNDQISEGALRIRNLKRDIRERAEIDHDWDDITDAGKHKKITYVDPLGADPATETDQGYTYTKNVSGVVELHWKDEVGNVLQITAAGRVPGTALANDAVFAAGTKMLFQQTAAPTGWTKDVTQNDKALRVVSGTVGSGGATAFTTVFGAGKSTAGHALTIAELPSHTHPAPPGGNFLIAGAGGGTDGNPIQQQANATGATGGDAAHSHGLSLDLQYVDVIIATKN